MQKSQMFDGMLFVCSNFVTCTESGLLKVWGQEGAMVGVALVTSCMLTVTLCYTVLLNDRIYSDISNLDCFWQHTKMGFPFCNTVNIGSIPSTILYEIILTVTVVSHAEIIITAL